jgi:nicotinamide-nucleotide amidase
MFRSDLLDDAASLIDLLRTRGWMLATAESCTGGLIAGLITEIAGSSEVLERGYITYSDRSKTECLGVDPALLARVGAVSTEVARAMAEGAQARSGATLAVAVTGIAGPGGGSRYKPVGLVYIATACTGAETIVRECRFGSIGRGAVRLETVRVALGLLRAAALQGKVDIRRD